MEAVIGWFAGPMHSTGDYPASLKNSNKGLIPEFSPKEKAFVRGTADFFSLSFGPDTLRMGHRLPLFGQILSMDLRKVLGWIQQEYDNPAVLVAESGWFTDASVREEDTLAIYVIRRLLGQVLEGKKNVNICSCLFCLPMYLYCRDCLHYCTSAFQWCFMLTI